MPGRALAVAAAAIALTACDEPLVCSGTTVVLRNPANLACVPFQLASSDCPDIPAPPAWAACKHPCEAIIGEAACRATAGCRVARELCDVFDDRCEREGPFLGCLPIGGGEPAEGACADLAASACSTRDDCGAQYLHGPDCPTTGAAARQAPDGPDCHFSFVTCYDEGSPP